MKESDDWLYSKVYLLHSLEKKLPICTFEGSIPCYWGCTLKGLTVVLLAVVLYHWRYINVVCNLGI